MDLSKGPIRWFAENRVAANLMMMMILVSGLVTTLTTKQEVFPEISLDLIIVRANYLGASPAEVESAVCIRFEEAIQGVDDVKKIRSTASEGRCSVRVELTLGADEQRVLDDVKSRIDAIDTFPAEVEKPTVQAITNRRQVISVAVFGAADERSLKTLGEKVRDDLSARPGITLTDLASVRPFEITIEVAADTLRDYDLTIDEISAAIRRSSFDLPAGSIKTDGGEILLRNLGQAYLGPEFAAISVRTRPDGTELRLGEIARVVDGFADTDQFVRFDNQPAVVVDVFRTGDQNATDVAKEVRSYISEADRWLPEGIELGIWQDASLVLKSRLNLLLRNGFTGFILVFIVLALFLRFRLAFWVSLGIPISFMGAIAIMPVIGVSINLISLFAFIIVLGIVVDDAIIIGESVHTRQQETGNGLQGSIEGARTVSTPVIFAVLTTIAAFAPLLNIAGATGKVMKTIPMVVLPCLVFSLVESLLILPAHLTHMKPHPPGERSQTKNPWRRFQRRFSDGLLNFIRRTYAPTLDLALRYRAITVAFGVFILLVTGSIVASGTIRFVFFPPVEADFISAAVSMPQGTPLAETSKAVARLEESLEALHQERSELDETDVWQHVYSAIGEHPWQTLQAQNAGGLQGRYISSHLGEVTLELIPAEDRQGASSEDLAQRWRELTGDIADAQEVTFSASLFSPGRDLDLQLTGADLDQLTAASAWLMDKLSEYQGVYEVADSFEAGKREIKLELRPRAERSGLQLADLARQVRQAFYGEEAQRIQRGRDEIRVMIRYPEQERRSVGSLESMMIRTADGIEVPFSEVARVEKGRGFSTIRRVDRRRAVSVTATVDKNITTAGELVADLQARLLPDMALEFPGVDWSFEGQQAEQRDTMRGLTKGFILAMVVIFALLAIPLKSYLQPIVIMTAIPFGLVGAVWGHMMLGWDLTILSMFGIVAVTGVVVNDSLVMVDFINRHRKSSRELTQAIRQAGMIRFRPILLTSLTTFFGLTPLLLEKSMQARFLIPMAVSLAFGVLFSTAVTLIFVPCSYMILEDFKKLLQRHPSS
jgi:multidrug efflux pump subunit AcrB